MLPATVKNLGITGRRTSGRQVPGRYPTDLLLDKRGIAKPPMVPGGGLAGAARTVWGLAAVEGRLNVGSLIEYGAKTILGAMQAAVKTGGRKGVLESLAGMAAKSIVGEFERELKRQTEAAFKEGGRVIGSEMVARDRAARRAAEGAKTIFPAAERALAKQDYAAAEKLYQSLQEYHGTKTADLLDIEDIPPQPVTSISGWVQAAGLVDGQLAIQFKGSKSSGPVVCIYPGAGRAALHDLLAAASAGKWVHSHVYRAAYELGAFHYGA
jgi:hypothetical protein